MGIRMLQKFTVLAGVMAALLAGPVAAQQPTKLTLRMSWSPFGFHTAMFYAIEKGWFKDGGVLLEPEDGNGSATAVNLAGSGRFDIGEGSVSVMAIARDKGMPLKAIACFIRGTELGVLVPRGSSLRTPKDLEGKKVAYTAGSLESPFIESFLRAGGADPSKVGLLNVDAAAKISIYVAGQADGSITSVPFILPALEKTRPSDTIMFADYGFNLPSVGYVVTEETLRTKHAALQTFVTVMSRAFQDVLENGKVDEAIAAEIKQRPQARLTAEDLRAQVEAYRKYFYTPNTRGKPQGWQSPEDWRSVIEGMQKVSLISASAAPEDFYTNEFFPK